MQTHYLVVDAFPQVESDAFADFAGAVVGCWIREDLADVETGPEALASRKLAASGWRIAKRIVLEFVSEETYAGKEDGRAFFEQAQVDGFVANFHVRPREVIGEFSLGRNDVGPAFCEFARALASNGAMSLYSSTEKQWANGVAPGGDEFLPLWLDESAALTWLQHWPGYQPCNVTAQELRSGFLDKINETEMWVALGFVESALMMFHPVGLKEVLDLKPHEISPPYR